MQAVIWSKPNCPHCVTAKNLLIANGIEYDEHVVGVNATKEDLLAVVPNARSVPQVFIDDKYVGTCDQLKGFLAGV